MFLFSSISAIHLTKNLVFHAHTKTHHQLSLRLRACFLVATCSLIYSHSLPIGWPIPSRRISPHRLLACLGSTLDIQELPLHLHGGSILCKVVSKSTLPRDDNIQQKFDICQASNTLSSYLYFFYLVVFSSLL